MQKIWQGKEKVSYTEDEEKRKKRVESRMIVEAAQWQGDSTSLFIPCTVFQSKIIKWCLKGELQFKR